MIHLARKPPHKFLELRLVEQLLCDFLRLFFEREVSIGRIKPGGILAQYPVSLENIFRPKARPIMIEGNPLIKIRQGARPNGCRLRNLQMAIQ